MKTEVTNAELEASQNLSQMILLLATEQPPHVGMGAMIMAMSVGAASLNIPLENATAMIEKMLQEVYAKQQQLTKTKLN